MEGSSRKPHAGVRPRSRPVPPTDSEWNGSVDPADDLHELSRYLMQNRRKDREQIAQYYRNATVAICQLAALLRTEAPTDADTLLAGLSELRSREVKAAPGARLNQFFTRAQQYVEDVAHQGDVQREGGWTEHKLPTTVYNIPGMDGRESLKYYSWVSSQLAGLGHVAELGCWLGQSTYAIATGLYPKNVDIEIHVYDSFVWRNWMNKYLDPAARRGYIERIPAKPGESFEEAFRYSLRSYAQHVFAHPTNLRGGPTKSARHAKEFELLVYDMGPDPETLNAFWTTFSDQLIPCRSIVVFNEYGCLRSSAIWEFCNRHSNILIPLHKPRGTLKSYLFCKHGEGQSKDD